MHKYISFVRLDIMTIKPYFKTLMILLLMSIGMVMAFKTALILPSYLIISLSLIVSYPFSIGDKYGMDILYSTLSLHRKNIVFGRYLFAFFLELFCLILVIIMMQAFSTIINLRYEFNEVAFIIAIASLFYSFSVSIQYPIYFKLGYNKAKYIGYVPVFLISMGSAVLPGVMKNFNFEALAERLNSFSIFISAICFFAGILILTMSCFISERIYACRDI